MLTIIQFIKVAACLSDETDVPWISNDPKVNWFVDMITEGESFPYDSGLYLSEIKAYSKLKVID